MALGNLIKELEKLPQDAIVPYGFGEPMSYRGDYCQLCFEPAKDAVIGDMLKYAKSAMNKTFGGYKGGDYEMHEWSDCHIDAYSQCGGDRIGMVLINMWRHSLGMTNG